MHRCRAGAVLAALALAAASRPLTAQSHTTWLVGAGLSLPAGEFNSYANKGWDLSAAWERGFGTHPFAIRLELSYDRNADTTGIGFHETTRFFKAVVNAVYHFDGARPHLYALLGLGALARRFTTTDPDDPSINDAHVAFQVGEGVNFRIRSAPVYLEGRFLTAAGPQPLQTFIVVAGIRLGARRGQTGH